jgi:hypothetical protein
LTTTRIPTTLERFARSRCLGTHQSDTGPRCHPAHRILTALRRPHQHDGPLIRRAAQPLPGSCLQSMAQDEFTVGWRRCCARGTLETPQRVPMAGSHPWSVMLTTSRLRRPRWLSDSGRLTSDPRRALRLISAEVAAQRLQAFMRLRGWELSRLERFQLVPAPQLEEVREGQEPTRGAAGWHSRDPRRLSA